MAEPTALREGRLRHEEQQRAEAIELVRAYRAWLRAGCDPARVPERLPRDADFRLVRAAR